MKTKYTILLLLSFVMSNAYASINVDRTRIVFSAKQDTVSMTLSNNAELPYLAEAWIEDENGQKVLNDFVVIPPIQRIEANGKNQIKIVRSESSKGLPDNKETLYYLNIKEVPPKSEYKNNMQVALKSKLKIFYRPTQILTNNDQSWLSEIKVSYKNKVVKIDNPTAYYINIADVVDKKGQVVKGIGYNMLKPQSFKEIKLSNDLSPDIKIGYIDDYGAIRILNYHYNDNNYILQGEE